MLGVFEKCLRCGRQLNGEKARFIGYGSHCKKVIDDERAKLQVTIYEFIEEEKENEIND